MIPSLEMIKTQLILILSLTLSTLSFSQEQKQDEILKKGKNHKTV